jgi:hypothetical protein
MCDLAASVATTQDLFKMGCINLPQWMKKRLMRSLFSTRNCGQVIVARVCCHGSVGCVLVNNPLSIPACARNPNSTQWVTRKQNKLTEGMEIAEGFVGRRKNSVVVWGSRGGNRGGNDQNTCVELLKIHYGFQVRVLMSFLTVQACGSLILTPSLGLFFLLLVCPVRL